MEIHVIVGRLRERRIWRICHSRDDSIVDYLTRKINIWQGVVYMSIHKSAFPVSMSTGKDRKCFVLSEESPSRTRIFITDYLNYKWGYLYKTDLPKHPKKKLKLVSSVIGGIVLAVILIGSLVGYLFSTDHYMMGSVLIVGAFFASMITYAKLAKNMETRETDFYNDKYRQGVVVPHRYADLIENPDTTLIHNLYTEHKIVPKS